MEDLNYCYYYHVFCRLFEIVDNWKNLQDDTVEAVTIKCDALLTKMEDKMNQTLGQLLRVEISTDDTLVGKTITATDGKTNVSAVVPDDKLSLAIGKSGQNVRLAARLTGWRIDVKAKSAVPSLNLEEHAQESYENLFDGEDAFDDIN